MKYRLIEKIGSGGMAEVFRAAGEGPEGFERAFVIKRIHPRLSEAPEFVRMFVDEAKISARLVHPNIVQVFEFVYDDGSYYIVMEPVDGVDMGRLFRRLERKQEVPSPLFFAEVARQVCRGLEFAHALTGSDGRPLGVVHRDVTPPNIMVDWNGTVKILDFGIARAIQDLQTNSNEAGIVKGKMSYVAPEQLEGRIADARSDVFSLAVVLHELLSGRRLFRGESDLETLKLVREMPIAPPSAHNPGVKPALDAIVLRALERDPARRYQSAREMGDELEEFVLRRYFSTRALAEKMREMAPVGDEDTVDANPIVAPYGDVREAPGSIGRADAVIVLEGAADRRRQAAPPPAPPAASAPRAPAPGVNPSVRPGFRLSAAASWILLAVSFSAIAGALFLLVLVKRSAAPWELAVGASAGERPPGGSARTVQVSLDSVPQGAAVTSAQAEVAPGTTASGSMAPPTATAGDPGAGVGAPLGQTPLILHLPRSDVPVNLILTKPGFAPLSFRVIANRDKDAVATLVPAAALPVAASSVSIDETPRQKRKSARRAAREAARNQVPAIATSAQVPAVAVSALAPAPASAPRSLAHEPSAAHVPSPAARGQVPAAATSAARPVAVPPAWQRR